MKAIYKFLITIVIIIIVIFLALFGWKLYAESHTNSANVRSYAKLNPLIKTENYYVKTEKPKKAEKLDENSKNYTYKNKAYNDKGHEKTIEYTATKKLKRNHYLALKYSVGEVRSYKEVSLSKVPKKVRDKLKNN